MPQAAHRTEMPQAAHRQKMPQAAHRQKMPQAAYKKMGRHGGVKLFLQNFISSLNLPSSGLLKAKFEPASQM